MKSPRFAAILLSLWTTLGPYAVAAEEPLLESETSVSPPETAPLSQKYKFSAELRSDATGVVRGNSGGSTFLGALTLGAALDLEKLADFQGLTSLIQVSTVFGGSPSELAGDFQGVSNISATHATKLYQAWLQRNLWHDRLSILAGLHDLNSEFYATESSGIFLNSSFGVGPELARSGKTGPSIWPAAGLAGRARVQITDQVQMSAAVYDAVPGDPEHPDSSAVILTADEGFLAITEAALVPKINGLRGKYGFGAWFYNRAQDSLSEVDENGVSIKRASHGIYLLLDQKLYAPNRESPSGLSGFFRMGWSASGTSPVEYAAQTGLSYTGLFPKRAQDVLALGAAMARAGDDYRAAVFAKGSDIGFFETTLELSYRLQLTSWLQIQPDLQWVISPSMNAKAPDALVAAGRLGILL